MAHQACPPGPAPPGTGPRPASSAGTRTGVPLSVWPAIPPPGPCPASLPRVPCPQRWPPAAAAVVVTALSSLGDLVVAPDPAAGVFAAAAAGAGRRVPGPAVNPPDGDLAAAPGRADRPAARRLARLRAGPGALLAGFCPDAGQAALAVVTWCATPGCPAPATAGPGVTTTGAGEVFAACHRVLAPGGLLAVLTNAARHPGHAGDVAATARAAGLIYTQHIIAVHAAISGGRLNPPTTAPARPQGRHGPAGPHRPVHSDILLFRRPGGPRDD